MGYQDSLEAAGAKILDFMESGDYQGTWYALVDYNGKVGLAHGSYGSCSGCDAFQAEFDDVSPNQKDLAAFGREYLSDIITFEEAIKKVEEYSNWDLSADDLLKWLKSNQQKIHNSQFTYKVEEELS